MPLLDNKDVYSTVEFDCWAQRDQLLPEERFILKNYMDPQKATIEAGTAGGRIVQELQSMGFSRLHGFDFVPSFIEQAKQRDATGRIRFEVQDARALGYLDESFGQIVYLQQIVSLIETEEGRLQTVREAYRILEKGGTAVFSFLSYETRRSSPLYALFLIYLRVLRLFGRSVRSLQVLPWLRLGGKFNWASLLDRGPHVYWYRASEAADLLRNAGFEVIGIGTSKQIVDGRLCSSAEELTSEGIDGAIYCVCRK